VATLSEIATVVGAPEPASLGEILCVSSVETADRACLVFATDAGTLRAALNSAAGAILTHAKLLQGETSGIDTADPRLIEVGDPRYAFALAARFLRGLQEDASGGGARRSAPEIHPAALVGESVQVGRRTRIGAYAVIAEDVTIGDDCTILGHVSIYSGTTLGDRVVVQAGAVLGSTGFGYARNPATGEYLMFPQQGTLTIEDDVEIGANTTIDRGALGETRIGAGTKIDNLVHIAHNCVVGKNVIIAAQTGVSGSSVIEDGAILGGQVGLGEHAHVGPGVILGGGAGVLSHKKVRGPGEVFWGRPARPLKQYLKDLAKLKKG
jgi:UDP-3-O-[3-hydroxymyristoyl] glucosamine N-acyltransferase